MRIPDWNFMRADEKAREVSRLARIAAERISVTAEIADLLSLLADVVEGLTEEIAELRGNGGRP